MNDVSDVLRRYYSKCFAEHGASAPGVDWHNAASLALHYDKMLAVIEMDRLYRGVSVLDVGCGYGGLLDRAIERGIDIEYTGIDIVPEMVSHGQCKHPDASFAEADIFSFIPGRTFDYVVANGVLTEKLDVSIRAFDQFSRRMIRRMFDFANRGIAFNMMTSYVNFTASNLFYQNPGELISFCSAELSPKWRLDHAYPHYDFTMYVFRAADESPLASDTTK
jgi:SAM-dependent methyltransferase